ncbi:MAG: hypothetical protein WCS37_01400 [Chloroflexota bacterium]|nr:hypothetical protein [Chloroflexota bacterium]
MSIPVTFRLRVWGVLLLGLVGFGLLFLVFIPKASIGSKPLLVCFSILAPVRAS